MSSTWSVENVKWKLGRLIGESFGGLTSNPRNFWGDMIFVLNRSFRLLQSTVYLWRLDAYARFFSFLMTKISCWTHFQWILLHFPTLSPLFIHRIHAPALHSFDHAAGQFFFRTRCLDDRDILLILRYLLPGYVLYHPSFHTPVY